MKAAFLLGFRGAGKTTLGRSFAAQAGWDFWDLDEIWEKKHGRTILSLVELEGEESFRRSEEALLRETLAHLTETHLRPVMVATGGGIVSWAPSRALLQAIPYPKIFLVVDPKTLWNRLKDNPDRKKIGGLTEAGDLEALLAERVPHFEKIATYQLPNQDISQSLVELNQLLGQGPGS